MSDFSLKILETEEEADIRHLFEPIVSNFKKTYPELINARLEGVTWSEKHELTNDWYDAVVSWRNYVRNGSCAQVLGAIWKINQLCQQLEEYQRLKRNEGDKLENLYPPLDIIKQAIIALSRTPKIEILILNEPAHKVTIKLIIPYNDDDIMALKESGLAEWVDETAFMTKIYRLDDNELIYKGELKNNGTLYRWGLDFAISGEPEACSIEILRKNSLIFEQKFFP